MREVRSSCHSENNPRKKREAYCRDKRTGRSDDFDRPVPLIEQYFQWDVEAENRIEPFDQVADYVARVDWVG